MAAMTGAAANAAPDGQPGEPIPKPWTSQSKR